MINQIQSQRFYDKAVNQIVFRGEMDLGREFLGGYVYPEFKAMADEFIRIAEIGDKDAQIDRLIGYAFDNGLSPEVCIFGL